MHILQQSTMSSQSQGSTSHSVFTKQDSVSGSSLCKLTFEIRWKICCETFEVYQLLPKLQVLAVEQYRQNSLCSTGIIDDLVCKEHLSMIVRLWGSKVLFLPPFEQEYQSIHRSARYNLVMTCGLTPLQVRESCAFVTVLEHKTIPES